MPLDFFPLSHCELSFYIFKKEPKFHITISVLDFLLLCFWFGFGGQIVDNLMVQLHYSLSVIFTVVSVGKFVLNLGEMDFGSAVLRGSHSLL